MSTPEEIRRKADDILARPEYREATPGLVERALDWLSRKLGEVVSSVGLGSRSGGYIVGYAILIAALIVLGWIAWRVFPRGGGRRVRGGGVSHQSIRRASRAEWLARATEAEAGARWAEAVHARYHALTTGLADRSVLPAPESTTSGEHRAAFARRAGAAPATGPDPEQVAVFDGVTDRYEHVWFGGREAAPEDSRSLAAADQRLLEQA